MFEQVDLVCARHQAEDEAPPQIQRSIEQNIFFDSGRMFLTEWVAVPHFSAVCTRFEFECHSVSCQVSMKMQLLSR